MYIPQDSPLVLHLPTSWWPARSRSLPHMHVQRWDLARFRTCDRTNRRRTRYHCASDPAFSMPQKLISSCLRNFHVTSRDKQCFETRVLFKFSPESTENNGLGVLFPPLHIKVSGDVVPMCAVNCDPML